MNKKAFTLLEVAIATILGMLIMLGSVITIDIMQRQVVGIQATMANDMDWIEANRHLVQMVRNSSYLTLSNQIGATGQYTTLILYNYDDTEHGRYVNNSAQGRIEYYVSNGTILQSTFPSAQPQGQNRRVNATFAYPAATATNPDRGMKNGQFVETIINYTTPFASTLCLKCRSDIQIPGGGTWAHTIGVNTGQYNYATAVWQTADHGYIAICENITINNIYLLKFGSDGKKVWSKRLTGYTGVTAGGIGQQTTDGGYAIVINVLTDYSGTSPNIFLYKTDGSGNIQWSKSFNNPGKSVYAKALQQTSDGGYVIAGYTQDVSVPKSSDLYIVKTDSNGTLTPTWPKVIGAGGVTEYASCIQQMSDGGYVIGGGTDGGGLKVYPYVARLNSSGSLTWSTSFNTYLYGVANAVQKTIDGGCIFLFSEANNSVVKHLPGFYLMKIDSFNNVQYTNHYESVYYCPTTFHPTKDGGYIVTGWAPYQTIWYVLLYKINSSGGKEWSHLFGIGSELGGDVQQTADGGYVIIGYTYSFTPYEDGFIIKTDQNGDCPECPTPATPTVTLDRVLLQ